MSTSVVAHTFGLITDTRRSRFNGISRSGNCSCRGSMSNAALQIKKTAGAYPERKADRMGWLDKAGSRAVSPLMRWRRLIDLGSGGFVDAVAALRSWAASRTDEQIPHLAGSIGLEMRRSGFTDHLVAQS